MLANGNNTLNQNLIFNFSSSSNGTERVRILPLPKKHRTDVWILNRFLGILTMTTFGTLSMDCVLTTAMMKKMQMFTSMTSVKKF